MTDEDRAALLRLIGDLTDPDDCWFDHHGYCQAHGWTDTDPRCPHARAREVLAGETPSPPVASAAP